MLIYDFRKIGNRLYKARKARGLTQAEVAERARLSDRTYADIERGTVNMRIETALRICEALQITPNDLFCEKRTEPPTKEEIEEMLEHSTESERQTALWVLEILLRQ
jgi:transcriptional regulator with XRE-family HTH domain